MFTWINKIPLAAALLSAAACLPASDQGANSRFQGPPPTRMAVAGGQVVIAGPKGFCIDRDASRDQSGKLGLSVLSSCRELGQSGFGSDPAPKAVLTAAVAARPGEILIGPAAPDLTRFFKTKPGRAMLSRSGRAETVALKETMVGQGAYVMYLTDKAAFDWGVVQADYWRALLPLGGRMVTLSVLGQPERPLSREEGLTLLKDFITATQSATAALPQHRVVAQSVAKQNESASAPAVAD